MTESPEAPGAPPPAEPTEAGQIAHTPPPPPPPPTAEGAGGYPVHLELDRQEEYSRFMPLIKWLILLPHYIVLVFLAIGAFFAILFSFFAVLFTRRYPRGLFDFVVGVQRWAFRVYGYLYLATDSYPPFSLDDDADLPVRFTIDYPEEVDRWRPLVHWLLIIPYLVVTVLLVYLAELLAFFAFFTILFTKRFPEGMFNIVRVAFRWQARANAYLYWVVTEYPPWVWD